MCEQKEKDTLDVVTSNRNIICEFRNYEGCKKRVADLYYDVTDPSTMTSLTPLL